MKGKTMNKKQLMYDRINKHGEDLKRIFKLDPNIDPVKLCKQLFRLENKAHKLAEDYCNGIIYADDYDVQTSQILTKVENILKNNYLRANNIIFANGDPRGYALKIRSEYVKNNNLDIHRDWGGYGIIAPDLREDL
jgi:hypothetical protein